MASKNVKTLHITWVQWATLIASVATLFLVMAPRFRQPTAPLHQGAGEVRRPEGKQGGPQRQRGRYEQQPELIAP